MQEPVLFRGGGAKKEGGEYLLALVSNYETMGSELHLLDTREGGVWEGGGKGGVAG